MSAWIPVRAHVELLSTSEGGTSSTLRSGYRSILLFEGAEEYLGFELGLEPNSELAPGTAAECTLYFWAIEAALNMMAKSQRFELREGPRVIGRGWLVNPTKPTEEALASFRAAAKAILAATPVADRLAATAAVVLERLARGGGGTNWFHCDSPGDLDRLVPELRPGSKVSFYFDRRIAEHRGAEAQSAAGSLLDSGEVLVGILAPDGFHIEMNLPDRSELQELFADVAPDARVFLGVFPSKDNDGYDAVTLVVPDLDGVVRQHPY